MTKEDLRKLPKDLSKVYAENIDLEGIKILFAYKAMKSEVDLSHVINKAEELGIKVVYPEKDPYCFQGITLKKVTERSLMLVPGVAFTKDGKRLGRGGGFYDRTLSVIPSCIKTIGICKQSQIVEYLPTEPHDRQVDTVMCFANSQ